MIPGILMVILFLSKFSPFFSAVRNLYSSSSSNKLNYSIRLATKKDIGSINECNLRNLPENYHYNYYLDHLLQWPELSLVAENSEKRVVGYALGRVQLSPTTPSAPGFPPSFMKTKYIGHVASIAIDPDCRGQGIAQALMQRIHRGLAEVYNIDKSTLFVRESNTAAISLYSKVFGYKCESKVSEYYADQEDAWFMTFDGLLKDVNKVSKQSDSNSKEDPIQLR